MPTKQEPFSNGERLVRVNRKVRVTVSTAVLVAILSPLRPGRFLALFALALWLGWWFGQDGRVQLDIVDETLEPSLVHILTRARFQLLANELLD